MGGHLINFLPRMLMAAVAAVAAAALAGCAGTDFKRPDSQSLRVGTSTLADVKREMGPPMQTGESLRNGEKLAVARYAYANTGGGGTYPGVVPALRNKGDSAALYSYAHAKGSVFDMKLYNKTLVVSFDGNDVVSEVEYSSAGEK
jgi:hypothetical protein